MSNVLSVKNGAPLPQSGKVGGQMNHLYTYDDLQPLSHLVQSCERVALGMRASIN